MKLPQILVPILVLVFHVLNYSNVTSEDRILGCNGFIRSDLTIDFSKVEIKLLSKEGNLKDKIECAPNNGYFFLPLYDKGEYTLQISNIYKWIFEPKEVKVNFDGVNDICSKGKDIIFTFKGFRVFGKVDAIGNKKGPKGITVTLVADLPTEQKEVAVVQTEEGGVFEVSPVLPGSYILKASHPKWRLSKSLITFKIEKSNFEVPTKSLLFAGYDVTGSVVSSGEPIAGVHFVLFSASDNKIEPDWISGCNPSLPQDFDVADLKLANINQLCYVTSNEKGVFSFSAVPSGDFVLVPFYKGANLLKFEVHPRVVRFTLSSDSHIFSKPFLVSGFSIVGRILSNPINGKPIPGLKVILNREKVVETGKDGSFVFDGVKTGLHNIQVKGDDHQFKDVEAKISPNSAILDPIYPSAFKVCGNIHKLQAVQIVVTFVDANEKEYTAQTNNDGSYCLFLPAGSYNVKMLTPESQLEKLLWFFPVNHSVNLVDAPLKDVNFRQETAQLTGIVKCVDDVKCEEVSVVLRGLGSLEEEYHEVTKGGKYKFVDLYPGFYELSVFNSGNWCWEHNSHKVSISEVRNEAPMFKRIGISFMVSSSHDTKLKYKKLSNKTVLKEGILDIESGVRQYCLPGDAVYQLEPIGCHTFAETVNHWEVGQDSLMLTALSHEITAVIVSSEIVDDIFVRIYGSDEKSPIFKIGPLKAEKEKGDGYNYKYEFQFQAIPDEKLKIVPESPSVLFSPTNLTVHGYTDCAKLETLILAKRGVRLEGSVVPALENVKISILNEVDEVVASMFTDASGKYKFVPLQSDHKYRVVGEKKGYILSGPFENGVFKVHKLAEIQVNLVDDDNKTLQGVLLSLSGGENYRQTSQSNADGKITFLSLKPSEYYLRPMLKEYKFSPPSKVVKIQEGETIVINFVGHRVLYSVFGSVFSLNHFPEKDIVVEAVSKIEGECQEEQEEGTTDENGNFRIRGLRPGCSYDVRLKQMKQGYNANKNIHKSLPEDFQIKMSTSDINDVNLIAIPEATQSDVSVFLELGLPEYLRTLVLRLLDDDGGIIYTLKLSDWKTSRYALKNVLLPFPTLSLNSKNYFMRLESSLPKSTYIFETLTTEFTTNTTFQLINMAFRPELKLPDSDIKHSYTSAIVILMLGLIYWGKDSILSLLSQFQSNSGITISEFLNKYSQQQSRGKDTEKTFIEFEPGLTVVKRKLKPRKM